ncbi:(2Fe-2S) ferredoxin domain-containing protein [Garciella nitratireducens]|uniref:Thioredoxin-like [2Fe-2S] ferredoxin n=1 Tax=Garciella nitratireducens DSM 15102 TaxID=1121911 RepID=A0A1T4KYN9_9FIRM|nr:NAD(P)H-dependent oxidoreductase subunit E [Garciella nitratireducens]RBP38961.1 thioredoxin-like protein [Garciella nitratireducens]SJZ47491.1 Thioredoxin-like [2Fe-2S] ferredoxin [Garciella nitratireducens DSM 15102]
MKVEICVGSRCTMYGADHIIHSVEDLQESILNQMDTPKDFDLEVSLIKCMGRCKNGKHVSPVVIIDGEVMENTNSQEVMSKIIEKAKM